jgi:hypothetical protein
VFASLVFSVVPAGLDLSMRYPGNKSRKTCAFRSATCNLMALLIDLAKAIEGHPSHPSVVVGGSELWSLQRVEIHVRLHRHALERLLVERGFQDCLLLWRGKLTGQVGAELFFQQRNALASAATVA